ncbi:MAG: hypothetical protein MRZ79_12450 [Bacteroidia bacterium]|nr:hypothetical protein [Bacteroidia bacterium]
MLDPEILTMLNEDREESALPTAPEPMDQDRTYFAELEIDEDVSPIIKELQQFEEEEPGANSESEPEDSPIASSRALTEGDLKGFGELVSDFVGTAKDLLDIYFDNAFQEKLQEEFNPEQKRMVDLMIFLDQEGVLSYQNKEILEEWANQYETKLPELISLWVRYTRIRKKYQSTPYRENYKVLIEKYTYKVLRKYWGEEERISPEWILFAILAVVLGFDVARLFWNDFQEKRKRRKDNRKKKKAEK